MTVRLLFALLFLFFVTHALASSSGLGERPNIIAEIIAKKLETVSQVPKNGHVPKPYTSPEIEFRINQNDLPSAAIVALCEGDIVALNVVCYYLFDGLNVWAPDTSDDELIRQVLETIDHVAQSDDDDITSLHLAAQKGWLGIVETLLIKSGRINEQNRNRHTPFNLALLFGHFKIVERLMKKIGGVDEIIIDNDPLLHYAARRGLVCIVNAILTKTDCIDELNSRGSTPLNLALRFGHFKIAETLVKKFDNVDGIIIDNDPLLH